MIKTDFDKDFYENGVTDNVRAIVHKVLAKKQKSTKLYYHVKSDEAVVLDRAVAKMLTNIERYRDSIYKDPSKGYTDYLNKRADTRVKEAWATIMTDELVKSHEQDMLTDKLVYIFFDMISRIQTQFTYDNADDKEDTKSKAILQVAEKWKTFDMTMGTSIFSWFTQVIKNGMYAGWNDINKKKTDYSTSNIFDEEM